MRQYAVYQPVAGGTAFFNPLHFAIPAVGDVVHEHSVLLVGTLHEAEEKVAAINAALPQMPTFGELLGDAAV